MEYAIPVNVINRAIVERGVLGCECGYVHGTWLAILAIATLSPLYVSYHLIAYLATQCARVSLRGITSAAFAPYPHGCP